MGRSEPPTWLLAGLVTLGCALLLIGLRLLSSLARSGWRHPNTFAMALATFLLLTAWKSGFTRADAGHVYIFLSFRPSALYSRCGNVPVRIFSGAKDSDISGSDGMFQRCDRL